MNWFPEAAASAAVKRARAASSTDDNGGSFGSGGAADNWLVNDNIDGTDNYIVTTAWSTDDDTLGLVFNLLSAGAISVATGMVIGTVVVLVYTLFGLAVLAAWWYVPPRSGSCSARNRHAERRS
mgnify:CR=1 FL=1